MYAAHPVSVCPARRRRVRGVVTGGLWLAAMLASACGRFWQGRPVNVVIVAIDTLRADHLGCYGYGRPTSPRIDALAARSVVFEQAISQSPWTLPAFASILTGVVPGRHGAGEGKLCLVAPCGALDPDTVVLAEPFAAAGYRTASFVSNGFVGPEVGLGRGFTDTRVVGSGAGAVDLAVEWLARHRDEPVFLFVHLVEPHAPYSPPAEDARPFLDPAYQGPLVASFDGRVDAQWTDADRRRVVDLYDGDVHVADRLTGEVLDALERLGIDDRTVVVVVADHGEELFDRGRVGHGHSMHDELLHVPLLLRVPGGGPGRRVRAQVRTMDLFPTLLEATGLSVPAHLDGVSLLGVARGGEVPGQTRFAPAEFTFFGPELRALRTAEEKLVADEDHGTAVLFDLVADPGERVDVATERAQRVQALRRAFRGTGRFVASGLYVLVRGGTGAHRVAVRLDAPESGLGPPELVSSEAGDTAVLDPDGQTVRLDLLAAAARVTGVRLTTRAGATPPLVVESVSVDGAPIPVDHVQIGSVWVKDEMSFPLVLLSTRATVRRAVAPTPAKDGVPRVAFQFAASDGRSTLDLAPETVERLRALGYAP